MFGIGPGATRTIEPLGLIGFQQRRSPLRNDLLARKGFGDGFECTPTAGRGRVFLDAFRPLLGHHLLHKSVRGPAPIINAKGCHAIDGADILLKDRTAPRGRSGPGGSWDPRDSAREGTCRCLSAHSRCRSPHGSHFRETARPYVPAADHETIHRYGGSC